MFEQIQTNLNNYTNIFERIGYVADKKGFKNISDLAKYLGFDSPEKLYRLNRKPDAKPSFDIVETFTNKFVDLNTRWFVTGEGEPFLQDSSKNYKPVDTPDALVAIESVSAPIERKNVPPTVPPTVHPTRNLGVPQVVTVDSHGRDNIVFVSAKARAGYLLGYADPEYISTLPTYRLPGLQTGSYRMWEVEGRSMYPTLKHGNIVIAEWIESFEHMRDERVYVLVTKHDGIVIKRGLQRITQYGGIIAKSDNANKAEYPNLHIPPEDIMEIWYARMYLSADFSAPTDLYNRLSNLEADFFMLTKHLKEKGI